MMLTWGTFTFSINSLAWDELRHTVSFSHAENQRIGTTSVLQYTGENAETIELTGVHFPNFKGGGIETLRRLAKTGIAYPLISGTGDVLGRWVCEEFSEDQSIPTRQGKARRKNWTIRFKKYEGLP